MTSAQSYPFAVHGELLSLSLSSELLGFHPESIWNPSPSSVHRIAPYPVPQALTIGMRPNALTSAKFSPPPYAVVLEGGGRRWFAGVRATPGWHRWNSVEFEATSVGFTVCLDLEGMTNPALAAKEVTFDLIEFPAATSLHEVLQRGLAQQYGASESVEPTSLPEWWFRPIYCGWGDQVAHAMHEEGVGPERRAMAYCIQGLYERWIARLEEAGVPVGTITIDGGWSLTGVWEPDPIRWPDLKGFIRRQHQAGRKVLLWIGTWLWDGLAKDLSILGDGRQWTADPGNPAYRKKVTEWVTTLISEEGYDADGFKIDQLGYTPDRRSPRWCPRFGFLEVSDQAVEVVSQAGDQWGMELLYLYQKTICEAAKAAKPDALITSSTVHPYFKETFDMVRLHDMGKVPADLMETMQARADLAHAVFPGIPIDTDNWVHRNYGLWLDYTCRSFAIGVPCIFFTERFIIDWQNEPGTIPVQDLKTIAEAWEAAGYEAPKPHPSSARPNNDQGIGYQSE